MDSSWILWVLVVVVATATTVVGAVLSRRDLDCSSSNALVASFRQRFFLRSAVANGVALMGFVVFVLSANPWVYALGVGVALGQHLWLAPTRSAVEREGDDLQRSGCRFVLLNELCQPISQPGALRG